VSIESKPLLIQSPNFPKKYLFSVPFIGYYQEIECILTIENLPANKWIGIWTVDINTKLQEIIINNIAYNFLEIGDRKVVGDKQINTLLYTKYNSKNNASVEMLWKAIGGANFNTFKVKVAGKLPKYELKICKNTKMKLLSLPYK